MSAQADTNFSNRFADNFICELVRDPELMSTSCTLSNLHSLIKSSITRLDEFSSSLKVNLDSNSVLIEALESIPAPVSDIPSTIGYLIVVRMYLIEARKLDLPYPRDEIIDHIRSVISISDKPEVLIRDYCSNLCCALDTNKAAAVAGGLTGGLTGVLMGFPIGFFAGGLYLVTRSWFAFTVGSMLIVKVIITLAKKLITP